MINDIPFMGGIYSDAKHWGVSSHSATGTNPWWILRSAKGHRHAPGDAVGVFGLLGSVGALTLQLGKIPQLAARFS